MKYVIHLRPPAHWAAAGVEWDGFADEHGRPTALDPADALQFDTEAEALLFGLAECTREFVVAALTPSGEVVHGDVMINLDGRMTDDMAEMVVSSVLDVMPPRVRDVAAAAVRHLTAPKDGADAVVPEVMPDSAAAPGEAEDPMLTLPTFHAVFGHGLWALRPYND